MESSKPSIKKIFIETGKIILLSLLLIPLAITTNIFIEQTGSIEILGKGDTGWERSLSHPFICYSGPIPDTPIKYYCDYKNFFDNLLTFWRYKWLLDGIVGIYLMSLLLIIPLSIGIIYFRERKKFHKIS